MTSLHKKSLGKLFGHPNAPLESVLVIAVFIAATCFLTYNVISLPSLVIGDNFNWTPQNVQDILGPKIIRESYMGDIAVASTFKTGFLFPLTYVVTSLNLPSTLVYPALFYFLSMVTFYFLAKEFLSNRVFLVLSSILYVINPVTPYYFASIINAFSLVLLPLSLKFFVKAFKATPNTGGVTKNFSYSFFFLALSVSANEQFILSAVLLAFFMTIIVLLGLYRKTVSFSKSIKTLFFAFSISGVVFLVVNLPLVLSTISLRAAPWSTYFQGPESSRFFTTIDFTYRNADLFTVLRLAGDSGTGLGQTSWYDSPLLTNIFGYVLFGLFLSSAVILYLKKDTFSDKRMLFYGTIGLSITTVFFLFLMKSLPSLPNLQSSPLDMFIKTWENPAKLRVILLLSFLVTSFIIFAKLEILSKKNRWFGGLMLALILVCTFAYNSPWIINFAGETPMTEVAEKANWGSLYNQEYINITRAIQRQGLDSRGIILPYTHEAELYSSPNARVFQIVSRVNQEISGLFSDNMAHWSQTLGMLSIKTVAMKNNYNSGEILIFPTSYDENQTLNSIKSDPNFNVIDQASDYTIFNNKNCLPTLYASNYYVLYDNTATFGYAFDKVDFSGMPVFLKSSTLDSGLTVPSYITSDKYRVYAVGLTENQGVDTQNISIINGLQSNEFPLQRIDNYQNLSVYSSTQKLNPNDSLRIVEPSFNQSQAFPDSTLNSTSVSLGDFGSFTLNFNVKVLQNGNYSFLGPRVVLDSGIAQYYIIIHDNGNLELAVMQNGVFKSNVITSFARYNLRDPQNMIEVKVQRVFDQVSVYVHGNKFLSFSTQPKFVNVNLASEKSVSAYSNTTIKRDSSFGLFAIREAPHKMSYTVHSNSAEHSELTINSQNGDYAVVSQYLYTNLKHISELQCTEVEANVLFKAWIINQTNPNSGSINISINTENRNFTLACVGLAVTFSFVFLLSLILPINKAMKPIKNRLRIKPVKGDARSE
jgi:hypothetical protein